MLIDASDYDEYLGCKMHGRDCWKNKSYETYVPEDVDNNEEEFTPLPPSVEDTECKDKNKLICRLYMSLYNEAHPDKPLERINGLCFEKELLVKCAEKFGLDERHAIYKITLGAGNNYDKETARLFSSVYFREQYEYHNEWASSLAVEMAKSGENIFY